METPTGAVADIFGRKVSRLTAVIFAIVSHILILFSGSFAGFAIAFVFSALSYNFESGAGEALVYDSLILAKKENTFIKVAGRLESIMQLTSIFALIIGGAVGSITYKNVYYIAIFMNLITFMVGLFFKEPCIEKVSNVQDNDNVKSHISNQKKELTKDSKQKNTDNKIGIRKTIIKQYKDSISAIKGDRKLAYLIIFTSVISTFVTLSFFYLQVEWKQIGFVEWQIGGFLAVASFFGAVGALFADRVDKALGEIKVLKYGPILVCISIFMFYFVGYSVISFSVIRFVDSILFVATRAYINKLIPSDKRATILSFESMTFSFFMICLFPLFGLLSDYSGMVIAFIGLGSILLILSAINYRVLSRK